MGIGDKADRKVSVVTNHVVQREAMRASAEGGKSGKPPLEAMLARISAEVTAQADERRAGTDGASGAAERGRRHRVGGVVRPGWW